MGIVASAEHWLVDGNIGCLCCFVYAEDTADHPSESIAKTARTLDIALPSSRPNRTNSPRVSHSFPSQINGNSSPEHIASHPGPAAPLPSWVSCIIPISIFPLPLPSTTLNPILLNLSPTLYLSQTSTPTTPPLAHAGTSPSPNSTSSSTTL